ncbi:hypothetical protein [Aurantiacibacter poecillastricola]|uniref:hypothetical protein n=1 Tax=Aurantiacibacter poecillastricola TaxID=3064385 RepID=UPI00273DA94C|nr:hypothetical protein [Aurantiacibacter sp. 219JJ12-13]MDP5262616.1 hypothetical protein [Aurantiacibacter sp. 219JJ12-13]
MRTDTVSVPKSKRRSSRGPRELLAEALLALANGRARIAQHSERSWASITFAGARHRVQMVFEGEEAVESGECFIAFLPEHEFAIRGQLVADAAITEVQSIARPARLSVTCEILLLEEG